MGDFDRPKQPIVLLDNVYTKGAHITASAWKLSDTDVKVTGAITFSRTTKEQPAKVFVSQVVEIDCGRQLPADDDF